MGDGHLEAVQGNAFRVTGPRTWWESPWLWAVLAIVSAAPMMVASVIPMPDLYSHIGRYFVMMHPGEPDLARYYAFRWTLVANLGVDLPVWLLAHFMSVESAARLVVGTIPPLGVAGIYALSRAATGRVPPGALVALSLVWSIPLLFGFVNFGLGVSLAFLFAAAWIRLKPRPALRAGAGFAMGAILWICHLSAFGLFLIIVGSRQLVASFLKGQSLRQRVGLFAALLPLALPLGLSLLAPIQDHNVKLFENFMYGEKLDFAQQLLRQHYKRFDKICAVLLIAVAFAIPAFAIVRQRAIDRGLLLAGSVLALLFLVLPTSILGSYWADLRLLPVALIVLLIAVPSSSTRVGSIVAIAGLTMFLGRTAVMTADWRRWSGEAEQDLAALAIVPVGARIATFACIDDCVGETGWRLNGYDHLPGLAIPRRRVFINNEWDITGNGLLPIYNHGRGYNDVSSVLVVPRVSPQGPHGLTVDQRLATLPRDRFDFVWVFNQPFDEAKFPWLKPLYRGPVGVMFAIVRSPPVGEKGSHSLL